MTRHEQFKAIMREAGAHLLTGCGGPGSDDPHAVNKSRLEFWAVPGKGVVIAQIWDDKDGISTFADWPLGVTWDELRDAIKPLNQNQHEDENTQETKTRKTPQH